MLSLKNVKNLGKAAWGVIGSQKTVALLELGIAVIAVVHAIEKFRSTDGDKRPVGFRLGERD